MTPAAKPDGRISNAATEHRITRGGELENLEGGAHLVGAVGTFGISDFDARGRLRLAVD